MNLLESKYIRLLSIGLTAVFFLRLLFISWLTGGRWDLNEQIAFGDRLTEGFLGYSTGMTDLFFPSSPYFPGVGYLSYFYRLMGIDSLYVNNGLMLLTAVLVGLLYFVLLRKLTLRLYPELSKVVVTIVLIVLYATHFRQYMIYMSEFKPDTVLLVIATFSFLLLENGKKPGRLKLVSIGILLFVAALFKQSFFIYFSFVFLLVLLHRFFTIKEKTLVIGAYGIIGLLALWLIFMIPGLYYFSVDVMSRHPMLETQTLLTYFRVGIISNIIFLLAFLFFLTRRFRSFSLLTAESKYFLFAIFWFLFSAMATAKTGGNSGNLEVGIIVFFPFVIYGIDCIFKRFYTSKVFLSLTYALLITGILFFSFLTIRCANRWMDKVAVDQESIAFLSAHFKDKKAFIDGNTYIAAEMSGMKVLTELETAGHFNGVPGYDFHQLKEAIRSKKYDLFFLSQAAQERFSFFADKNIWKVLEQNYTIYEKSGMPEYLKGKILVPKQDK